MTDAYLEVGRKRVFANALDWPGWSRSGKDEARAIEALVAAAPRYAAVARVAGVRFSATTAVRIEAIERVAGSASTDFGVPGAVTEYDRRPLTAGQAERLASLVEASWSVFDGVVAAAPAELRKGPRGGGRDRDRIVEHVVGAEAIYAGKLGVPKTSPVAGDRGRIAVQRAAILEALRTAAGPARTAASGWPPRYAARRIAWHVLDHAWEIEDRTEL